jgi:hypothetical protein
MPDKEKESIVLRLHLAVFQALVYFSPLFLFNKYYLEKKGKSNKLLVEIYVLFCTILSLALVFTWSSLKQLISDWILVFVAFGLFRIFEIFVIQVNAMFYDFYRRTRDRLMLKKGLDPYVVRGYLRITVLLIHNIAEITFWFAIFYLNFPDVFIFSPPLNPITALTFSFFTMTTFGYPLQPMIPQTTLEHYCGHGLILGQAVIGLFATLLIISKFISLLRDAPSSDQVERRMKKEESAS